jgi:hypothetical protein
VFALRIASSRNCAYIKHVLSVFNCRMQKRIQRILAGCILTVIGIYIGRSTLNPGKVKQLTIKLTFAVSLLGMLC